MERPDAEQNQILLPANYLVSRSTWGIWEQKRTHWPTIILPPVPRGIRLVVLFGGGWRMQAQCIVAAKSSTPIENTAYQGGVKETFSENRTKRLCRMKFEVCILYNNKHATTACLYAKCKTTAV